MRALTDVRALRAGPGFDGLITVLTVLLTIGVFADGWSHVRFGADQSVLSVYHLTFYSAASVVTVIVGGMTLFNRSRGDRWSDAVPVGYGLTLAAVGLFLVAGVADLLGHALFGFEVGLEALVSPTHLPLFVAWFLIVTATLRSAAARGETKASASAVIAVTLAAAVVSFATQAFVAIGGVDWALEQARTEQPVISELLGVGSMLYQTVILVGALVWLRRRFETSPVAFVVVLVGYGALMASLRWTWWHVIPLAVAGIIGALVHRFDRSGGGALTVASVAAALWAAYFLTAQVGDIGGGVAWSGYIAGGVVFQAAAIAWLVAMVGADR